MKAHESRQVLREPNKESKKYKNTQLVKELISSCLEENSKYAVSFGVDRNVSVIVNHEQEDRNRSDDMPTASSTQSSRT